MSTTINVKTATTKELVEFFNAHSDKPVKKFADRATAEKRCAALAATLKPAARSAMSATARALTTKKVAAEGAAPHELQRDGVITVLVDGNPKFRTAAERYALYKTGMRVSEYLRRGGQRRDVTWDAGQGWIEVKWDEREAKPAAPRKAAAKAEAL